MNVDAKFKSAILSYSDPRKTADQRPEPPALTDPHVDVGDVIQIEPGTVWVTVLRRMKANQWAYRITDHREAYMGKVGGLVVVPAQALATRDDNGFEDPVVPPDYQNELTAAAQGQNDALQRAQRAKGLADEKAPLERRLQSARKVAKNRKVDISSDVRGIKKRLERIERTLEDGS